MHWALGRPTMMIRGATTRLPPPFSTYCRRTSEPMARTNVKRIKVCLLQGSLAQRIPVIRTEAASGSDTCFDRRLGWRCTSVCTDALEHRER